jgi:hypothetical protein
MSTQKLAVATVWMAAACFGAEPKVMVVIFDYAGTPGTTLEASAETARKALRMAGMETEWSICRVSMDPNEHCTLPPAGTYLEARVVPRAWEGLKSYEAMGFAMMPRSERAVVSYAFYQPVKELAQNTSQPVSLVLACVMAHEIGHLLGLKHSPSGIMKSNFNRRDLHDAATGFLHFNTQEAKVLRAAAGN